MFVSLDWVKDFVDLPDSISPKELLTKFTMTTAEVEEIKVIGEFWKKIKIAEVVEIISHPEADKLNLVTFLFGENKKARVVCGASNVKLGMKTAYAPIGTTLPVGFTLEPKKIRGILSEGMLCSEEELGLAKKSEGIISYPKDVKVGMSLKEYYNESEDIILDIDNKSLTHRPDLWGQYGIAREFAALYKKDLLNPYSSEWQKKLESKFNNDTAPIKINVDTTSAGISYWGLSLDNIKIAESPKWLKLRLEAMGLNPINNIVDISNYVMFELGQPLHIFDREKINGASLSIKRLEKDLVFTTLDDIKRNLLKGDTVIEDQTQPLVIAGIMGGLHSGISENTNKVFIEVANWKSSEVRKVSTRLGLRTDSSQRFEKTLDSKLTYRTLLRTLELIQQICPSSTIVGKPVYDGIDLASISSLNIKLNTDFSRKVLGKEVTNDEIKEILTRLDFKVHDQGNSLFEVVVPSYRATKDIECDADLIEELGRFIGYDNIVPISPKLDIKPIRKSSRYRFQEKVRNFLVYNLNSHEIMTYPLVGEKLYKKSHMDYFKLLKLVNAISKDAESMRDSLIPSILDVAIKNTKNFDKFSLFELGRTYPSDKKYFSKEREQLIFVNYSKSESTFLQSVNEMDRLLSELSLVGNLMQRGGKFKSLVVDENWEGLHPNEFLNFQIMGKLQASIFSLHPFLLKKLKIKGNLSIAILDYEDISSRELKDKTKYKPIHKTPVSNFDYTITLDQSTSINKILLILKKVKLKELKMNKILDIYSEGKVKHVTIRSVLDGGDITLSGEFISKSEEIIIKTLSDNKFFLKNT